MYIVGMLGQQTCGGGDHEGGGGGGGVHAGIADNTII